MATLSREVRRILDAEGLETVKIFASGGFDEYEIADMIASNARIDAYGVGTKMGVSADAPYLNIVYKMVRFQNRNVRKLSPGKATLAGAKQVFRKIDADGIYREDILAREDDIITGARPLLQTVMAKGRCLGPHPSLEQIRQDFQSNFSRLPERYKALDHPVVYPVTVSSGLEALQSS